MEKERYREYIQSNRKNVLEQINGYHELGYVLESLTVFISTCIDVSKDIYNDKDIDYDSYMELNESINDNLKEVCRIVKNR